jgi:methyl-accepting chemotaxis protein/methyl-accepting chemotaxis protein-1 (serine sensor receptor)
MSLTKKLLGAFGLMLALVLILSAGALLVTRSLNRDLDRAAKVTARSQYLAGDVDASTSALTSLERGNVMAAMLGDKEHASGYERGFQERAVALQRALASLREVADSAETSALVATLTQQAGLVNQAHAELSQAMANQQMDAAMTIFSEKVLPRLEEIGRRANELVEQENRELTLAAEESAGTAARGRAITLGLAIMGLAVGGLLFAVVRQANYSLRGLAQRIAQSAEQVANAASQVSESSNQLAEGASHQAASLEETSASTEEISSITRKNADHALQVAALVKESDKGAAQVNQTLDGMIEKMKEIDASSNKIARIIKVIDEIAFQTNILALNAAVEAARAGEAGLGFAVVADEVRNLAQRSAQAAKDTAGLIEESIATSRHGNAQLDQVAGAVRSMTDNSARVKALVDEVSLGSQEQARGMDHISHAVIQMEQVTQNSAAAAKDGATAGSELSGYAATLKELVEDMREMVGAG